MPTDLPAPTNRIDEVSFPIAIGFETAGSERMEADSICDQSESVSQDDQELEETESLGDMDSNQSQEPLTGYELVEDMMRRQDEVLAQLDDLNARIELSIKEISIARKSEMEAMEAELDLDDSAKPAAQPLGQRRAA